MHTGLESVTSCVTGRRELQLHQCTKTIFLFAGQVGIEPTANGLTVRCSTTELLTHFLFYFAGQVGIEPTTNGLTVRCSTAELLTQ